MKNNPPLKLPTLTLVTLAVMALIAVGMIFFPKTHLYYPHVVIQTPFNVEVEFLLRGKSDQTDCERSVANVANSIMASCPECRGQQQCLKTLSPELRQRFTETPLPVTSARFANGVITYKGEQTALTLYSCQESERQAKLKGEQYQVTCYPAGAPRLYTAFEKREDNDAHSTFKLLLALIGGLIICLVAALLYTHARQHTHANTALHKDNAPTSEGEFTPAPRQAPLWLEKLTLASVDFTILLGTFLALAWPASTDPSRWVRFEGATLITHLTITLITIGWFWLLLEHYARRRPFWDELRETLRVLAIMFMVSGAAAFVVGIENGRSSHLLFWSVNFLLIPLGRAGSKKMLNELGLWQRPALIVGTGENAREAYLAIKSERSMGYCIVGFIQVGANGPDKIANDLERQAEKQIIIDNETFPLLNIELLSETPSPFQIILAVDSLIDPENQTLIQRLLATHNNIHIIPAIRGLPLFGMQLSHFFSHEVLFLTVRNNLARRGYRWVKRAFDLIVTSLLLLLLSPLFLILTLLIRQSGGAAFYGHKRVGQRGQAFHCLKFRSMRPDADHLLKELLKNNPEARAEWEKDFKLKNDPRITPVGHFLRKTSLDELPQLINVLKGEMSLVGPRPVVEAELERYGDGASLYLEAKPGITGLWQVSGRNDTSYAERISLDSWYVQNWSLWYDIAILFKTVDVVLYRRGAY